MRSLIPTNCFLFKLNNPRNNPTISKSTLYNFIHTYKLSKLPFTSFVTVPLKTKDLCQKFNYHVMTSLPNITCLKLSKTETTETNHEVQYTNLPGTSTQRRISQQKEKKEEPRSSRCKESITIDLTVENHKPSSSTDKSKKSLNFITEKRVNNTKSNEKHKIPKLIHRRHSSVPRSFNNLNGFESIPGNINPHPYNYYSNAFFHALSNNQINLNGRRFDAMDYSNSTRASQLDIQQARALRSWQHTALAKGIGKSTSSSIGCTFKVMSYNVLAQELLEEHGYLYQYHNPNAIKWEQRWFTLLNEIKFHNADILCLQEVQASHVKEYFNSLHSLGYASIFKKRTGYRTDGCAIYYKHARFKLVEHTTVEFNQSNTEVLNRDNVAIIAKFAPRNDYSNEFVVATTHLLYNPRRENVRLAQTQVLLSEVDRIAYNPSSINNNSHVPVIITGDFNFSPGSAVYQLLATGSLNYDDLLNNTNTSIANVTRKHLIPSFLRITDQCQHADLLEHRLKNNFLQRDDELKLIHLHHSERKSRNKSSQAYDKSLFSTGTITHHFTLRSAYSHNQDNDIVTTFQDKWVTVDYIFYSGAFDEATGRKKDSRLKLFSRYKLPTSEQLQGIKMPNYALPSDHFPLLVIFRLDP